MQIYIAYTIAFGSLFGAVILLQAYRFLRLRSARILQPFLKKWLLYPIIFRRRSGSSDCTVLAALALLAYAGGNFYCTVAEVSSRVELTERLGKLFLVNLVPLYLGGRTSYIADYGLGMDLSTYHFTHRWVGRICLAHGLAHGIIHAIDNVDKLDGIRIALLSILAGIAVLSFVFVRRRAYELFLSSHACMAPALLVLLWVHVPSRGYLFYVTVGVSLALWTLQKLLWFAFFLRRNGGLRALSYAEIRSHQSECLWVRISLPKAFRVLPGQYVYITAPESRPFGLGYLEAHPFYIGWQPSPEQLSTLSLEDLKIASAEGGNALQQSNHLKHSIDLYLESARGFTRRISQFKRTGFPVLVDGPYGTTVPLDQFDKVLFLASGVGIAAQLLYIKNLVEAHNTKRARARRITICWLLETRHSQTWVQDNIKDILEQDQRRIMTLHTLGEDNWIVLRKNKDGGLEEMISQYDKMQLAMFIKFEHDAEAGNMAVFLCGPPSFEAVARKALVATGKDISLFTSSFQPGETISSRLAKQRFGI